MTCICKVNPSEDEEHRERYSERVESYSQGMQCKNNNEFERQIVDPAYPTRGLGGVMLFKGFLFEPSGKTKEEEQGNQLPETDLSKYSKFNSNGLGQVKSLYD